MSEMDYIAEPLRDLALPVGELNADPANVRTHDERNIATIRASLERFGQRVPVVVQKQGMIVRAGNARLQVARDLGWTHMAAIVVDEDDVAATAYAIADNRTAELAEWDTEGLVRTMQALPDDWADVAGFSDDELAPFVAAMQGEAVEDDVPEPDDGPPVARVGDVWVCGRHRVLCGDSTDEGCVAAVLGDVRPFIMVTDPPYGVEYDPAWRDEEASKGNIRYGATSLGTVANDERASWAEAYGLTQAHVAYIWHASLKPESFKDLLESGYVPRTQLVWAKQNFAISRGHYNYQHECCWYAVRKGCASRWVGDHSASTVWNINTKAGWLAGDSDNTYHGTQKPVECMARPIRNHGGPDDHVYDPFLGSGTTMIAAEQLNRTCYGIEIEPRYVDVCVRRWQNFTGEQATLEGDGRTFDEVAAERLEAAPA